MPLTFNGEPLINVLTLFEEGEEPPPECPPFLGMQKRLRIANQDEAISGAREEDVEAFGRVHKADCVGFVRSRKTCDYDITLLSLIVVYDKL